MAAKIIKNEQWYVKNLMSKIMTGDINKPKFQRKKKWDILPKKENNPNERKYIEFLFETQNSVHAITFGGNNNNLSNIDGNNRINAIHHFLNKPFEIFPEHLLNIIQFINGEFQDKNVQDKIISIFSSVGYNDLMYFKYNNFFYTIGEIEFYNTHLKFKRDEFEPFVEELQKKLKIKGEDNFDTNVKININLFEGYSTDELCKIFEDINKFNSKLTETELLACRLYNITNFKIVNNIIKISIQEELKKFYFNRKENEVLNCYEYNEEEEINAYDFMVGFQNYAHRECPLIEYVDNDGLSLFFKVYKTIYKGGFDKTFTNENINDFVEKINKTISILKVISNSIFMKNLVVGGKLFDAPNNKLYTLKKNNLFIIIVSIIGYINKEESTKNILNSIEKTILYHFFIHDISNKEKKEELKIHDCILYEAGGAYIDNLSDKIYKSPSSISDKITSELMIKVIEILLDEQVKPKIYEIRKNGKDKNDKRRTRKFFEKTLIYYYYKNKVSFELLDDKYWIEHICPFSSSWETQIDIDRLGNIIPIIDKLNSTRGTKHISEYKKNDVKKFIRFISDIIPEDKLYDEIVSHKERKPNIINNIGYNDFCKKNENIYKTHFISCLFH
jgi:hypothetical protein